LDWVLGGLAGVVAARGRFSAGALRGWVAGAVPAAVVGAAAVAGGVAAGRGGGTVTD